jgi:hypothetical protein
MYPIRLRPILACLILAALLPVKAVHAEDILSLRADGHESGLVSVIGPRGFITQLQVVDDGTLAEQVSRKWTRSSWIPVTHC